MWTLLMALDDQRDDSVDHNLLNLAMEAKCLVEGWNEAWVGGTGRKQGQAS